MVLRLDVEATARNRVPTKLAGELRALDSDDSTALAVVFIAVAIS